MNLLQKNDKGRAGMRKILLKAMAIAAACALITAPMSVFAEEVDGETEYFSMEDDPDVTVETVDEVLMTTYSTAYALNWSVGNKISKQTKEFSKTSGSTVSIYAKIGPTVKNVTIGIKKTGGGKKYIKATSTVNRTFTITKPGKYRVFVENKSGKTITVKGNYRR